MNDSQKQLHELGIFTVEIPVNHKSSNSCSSGHQSLEEMTISRLQAENEQLRDDRLKLGEEVFKLSKKLEAYDNDLFAIVVRGLTRVILVGALAGFITLLVRPNYVRVGAYYGAWIGVGIYFLNEE